MYSNSAIVILVLLAILVHYLWKKEEITERKAKKNFPEEWRTILLRKVAFFNSLGTDERHRFESKVNEFLMSCRITAVDTSIDISDRLLVAASAVIPIFAFPDWKYSNLEEVLIYPNAFNSDFETNGSDRRILGMVGRGYLNGKMILSKTALINGFKNESDKKNTAIHEFVHLIDKSDGTIDGIPSNLMEKQYTIPWIDLIAKKMDEIYEDRSDINPYGGTSRVEFFSVASEYFFERPKLLAGKHPELYSHLEAIFGQQMKSRNLKKRSVSIGRNSPCPCDSGLKFKKCCGKPGIN